MIDLTVIVPVRHHLAQLPTLLAHLEVQDYPAARFEIAVIDATSGGAAEMPVHTFAGGSPVRTRYHREDPNWPLRTYNAVLRAGEGQWVLFLAEDLLAGPDLVSEHVRTQERRRERVAVLGGVSRHPQASASETLPLPHPAYSDVSAATGAVHYLDWRWYNLSLPREDVLAAGGFCEDLVFSTLADVDLAYRLAQRGLQGVYNPAACAYAWCSASFDAQRSEHYRRGYSLYAVLQRVPNTQLYRRHALSRHALAPLASRFLLPLQGRLASTAPPDSYLRSMLRNRVLHGELQRGFYDAVAQRPPRLPQSGEL